METGFDIDLSGDSDLAPPGNLPGDEGGYRPPEVVDAEGALQGEEPPPAGAEEESEALAPTHAETTGEAVGGDDIDLSGGDDEADPGLFQPTEGAADEPFAREEDGDTEWRSEAVPDLTPDVEDVDLGGADPQPDESSSGGDERPGAEVETAVAESPEAPPAREAGGRSARRRNPPTRRRKAPGSGTKDRLYLIFKITQVEVEGQILDVPLQQHFEIDGTVHPGLRARNRDLALDKATKLFGKGFKSTLVAVPEGSWQPEECEYAPSEQRYSVRRRKKS